MLKLLFFITIIILINCAKYLISAESDHEGERACFYRNVKPINKVTHAGHLPLLTASKLQAMLDGVNKSIEMLSSVEPNSKALRTLESLKISLSFRLANELYKPENSEEQNNVQMIKRTTVFD
ncbi:uncharacterized protein [Chelonus insularis]|uniref:uncharacterized protein n=1 Tax=Chelonus insularis TaxID=460826 RepID=UPI00158AC350|nr:uncharacterized protein LOC118067616 [Chelonus insularis]